MKKPKYIWIMTTSLLEVLLSTLGGGRKEGEDHWRKLERLDIVVMHVHFQVEENPCLFSTADQSLLTSCY